ncbi:hypothetical protein C7999DRAFT_14292 [Corynascus novoguineensis]|uniref:Uncharacterized protein n=1 Tax=Corynascus novoguineensis TaxID=1126955 RepID=A0AAN7CUX7_9PEZI|nr:hypothetical protein C7999DRAFT_14292 [Corynascus novoguineensis]
MEPCSDGAVTQARCGPCLLEGLNTDCMLAILCASDSLADLAALIRALPAALHCFVSAKALVLREVMTNELGPAIRDAFIMSLTDNIDMFAAGSLEQTFHMAISGYREALSADAAPWIPTLDVDTATDMARLTRIVLYFVDLYLHHRIRHFEEYSDQPRGAWSTSRTERRRVAQALLRFEVIASLHHPRFDLRPGADRFFTVALELFTSWELEQISEIAHFVLALIQAFRRCDKHAPRTQPLPPTNHYHVQAYLSLPDFYAQLAGAAQRMADEGEPDLLNQIGLRVPWLVSSHQWLWLGPDEPPTALLDLLKEPDPSPTREGDDDAAASRRPIHVGDGSPTDPPWAWLHAWNGQVARRWGNDLVPQRTPDVDWDEHDRVKDLVQSWRWMGMVFWDKNHAEALLKTKVLEGCQTGWLAWYHNFGQAGV